MEVECGRRRKPYLTAVSVYLKITTLVEAHIVRPRTSCEIFRNSNNPTAGLLKNAHTSADQTWLLLAQTAALRERARRPVMTAVSRKGSIGKLLARETKPEERDAASTAAALFAARHGARILRVHDVGSMADALRVWQALESEEREDERA